jgi:hypothetical protein
MGCGAPHCASHSHTFPQVGTAVVVAFYNPRAISGLAYRCTGIGIGGLGDSPPNPLTWGTIASPRPPANGSVAEPR